MQSQNIIKNLAFDGVNFTVDGLAVTAASFHSTLANTQTVVWDTANFTGDIHIKATLDSDPLTAVWATLHVVSLSNSTTTGFKVLQGNFTYLKATVANYLQGDVISIEVNY
jgi:hypothetical protein